MRHLLAAEEMRQRIGTPPDVASTRGDVDKDLGLLYGGCKHVIVAGPSPDAQLSCLGANPFDPSLKVRHLPQSQTSFENHNDYKFIRVSTFELFCIYLGLQNM